MGRHRTSSKFERENPNVRDENGNFINWTSHFNQKNEYLSKYYDEVHPYDFIKDVLPKEHLDSYRSKSAVLPLVAFMEGTGQDEGLHSGNGTGILKFSFGVKKDGKPLTKTITLYDDYGGIELTQDNRFALINMCTYFGRNVYRKNSEEKFERVKTRIASECFGIAIDLDYVQIKQLERLFGKFENEIAPMPTYIVNSGAGLHLYYLFEQPVSLKYIVMQRYLGELKRLLTDVLWTNETSLEPKRQYQGIYQDMRIPGSWTKFGYKNKKRCSFIIKAYKTGKRVDFTYLEEFVDTTTLPRVDDEGSLYKNKVTLEECATLYPKWYERVVIKGEHTRQAYTQNRGLYEWWKDIITQQVSPTGNVMDTSHTGNRFFCIRAMFVMAKKSGVPFEEVLDDALDLIPFMNSREHTPDNEFKKNDVMMAATFYEDNYVRWSNETLERQTGIRVKLFSKTRRNGRKQNEHLKRARLVRSLSTYEGSGRPSSQKIVEEWQRNNPSKKKSDCIKETGLSKPTVYRWWK